MLSTKPLLTIALEEEATDFFTSENVCFTGVGKVNATYALCKRIFSEKPSLVVNLGSAGSPLFNAGELVFCRQFFQRDMDARPLGFDLWETPFEYTGSKLEYGESVSFLAEGICGSGDSFSTSNADVPYSVVDMEAYALAKICAMEKIPFVCIKFISDGADSGAAKDWESNVKQSSRLLYDAYKRLLSEKGLISLTSLQNREDFAYL